MSCGAALPKETLYDFYRARHRCCPGCGVVVTDVAVYCPECGTRLSKETGAKGASG
ncbi:zinc-ribbon domain-containing protein [uncultured Dysosmobacter sp.]|uniref:zinc-ribbon domain-containing protein n=1 Tax=uncultured Dysosmobacter sp. TaxID=2591384 RepID=UPI0034A0CE10